MSKLQESVIEYLKNEISTLTDKLAIARLKIVELEKAKDALYKDYYALDESASTSISTLASDLADYKRRWKAADAMYYTRLADKSVEIANLKSKVAEYGHKPALVLVPAEPMMQLLEAYEEANAIYSDKSWYMPPSWLVEIRKAVHL